MEKYLIEIAKEKIDNTDPSHDIYHTMRVLNTIKYIKEREGGDLDILVPAAIFHDIICYPKNHPKSKFSAKESAEFAVNILEKLDCYPKEKIHKVYKAINECSFSKGIIPEFLEGKILQDADMLESTGIISIMRTFSSTGQMKKSFYHPEDPFCKSREPDGKEYALDLFYSRLLIVKDLMHTEIARNIAVRRTKILYEFLENFKMELYDDIDLQCENKSIR
ncbi:hypothetical protein CIW83_02105 [Tissierella sp. P1]|uniref:HD domain-containing protein n=1 Tax=Tissierella sp. P1 TaxID=1280483 RepID=UPI000BA166EC|nr:HD domain-containing protein [Tissierella sp. P1]OZV13754.1 hypothetical protein CIW83_02105 [Tissierella sp. P1]